MRLEHEVAFRLELAMPEAAALAFVRDVPRSLRHASFLAELQVLAGDPVVVSASLPVNAAFFGEHEVPFRSEVHPVADGARLVPLPLATTGVGWAEVAGTALVGPVQYATAARASVVRYDFAIGVNLALPRAERWGGEALSTVIRYTAATVLKQVTARFPEAVRAAAEEASPTV